MMIDVSNIGLVLEGGGRRGIFTCGVLDYFLEKGIEFPYVIGVSAGACNGLSYLSKQKERAKKTNIDLYEQYRYMGWNYLLKKKNFFDFDFMFHDIPERILPYDYDTYFTSEQRFEMVTTNCLTGEAAYLEDKDSPERVIAIAKASSSLPILSPITYVDNIPMLDGGIADSIPVERAQSQGYNKNVVVLTRNKGYRKKSKDMKIPSFIYKKYPAIRQALEKRNELYNYQLNLVEQLEEEGQIFVIRPERPIEVGRLERNIQKLEALYHEGYSLASKIDQLYL